MGIYYIHIEYLNSGFTSVRAYTSSLTLISLIDNIIELAKLSPSKDSQNDELLYDLSSF